MMGPHSLPESSVGILAGSALYACELFTLEAMSGGLWF
jgi:hypothetical protein